jgi:DNA-binding transcriptional MerR regulator
VLTVEYSIHQVSEKMQIRPTVLRFYEKEGLLPSVRRTKSGIRRYDKEDLEWIGLIMCLKNTGMSIKQIKDFVSLCVEGDETLKERCEMLYEHKRNVEAQIEEMHRHLEKVACKIDIFSRQYEEYRNSLAMKRTGAL